MEYKCILFDCDGVLETGFDIDYQLVLEQITGTSMKENLIFFTNYTGNNIPADFESEFRKRSFESFKTDLRAIDGVQEILNAIKVPVGVVSSGPVNKIKLSLTTTGLIRYFGNNIFSCFEIQKWKPEPDIYLHAAKQMNFSPKNCVVIEDSEPGIKAARAGGFDVYGFTIPENKNKFEELGATVFFRMDELFKLLKLTNSLFY